MSMTFAYSFFPGRMASFQRVAIALALIACIAVGYLAGSNSKTSNGHSPTVPAAEIRPFRSFQFPLRLVLR